MYFPVILKPLMLNFREEISTITKTDRDVDR